MPRNIAIASTAMVTSVAAAFFDSGGRNAGTPSDTASTPVIAVQPLAKAVRSNSVVSCLVPARGGGRPGFPAVVLLRDGGGAAAGGIGVDLWPVREGDDSQQRGDEEADGNRVAGGGGARHNQRRDDEVGSIRHRRQRVGRQ